MERTCEYPGCATTFSESVPLHITLCGRHQWELRKFRRDIASESLEEGDVLFIFLHPEGCRARELMNLLEIPESTAKDYLRRGSIKSQDRGSLLNHHIPPEEIKRVIILVRNWITIYQAASIARVRRHTLLAYVRQGHFGPSQIHLCGGLAIRKNQLPGLREKFEAIKGKRHDPKSWSRRRYLKDGEIMASEIAGKLRVTRECVHSWMREGRLVAERRQVIRRKSENAEDWWVVKWSDFVDFAQKAVAGEHPLRSRIKQALQEFLSQQNPP